MDIYFKDGYGKLYENIEGGIAETFNFRTKDGEIKHQFIKRSIPEEITDGKDFFDLITPYGYGGPIILWAEPGKRTQLCEDFGHAFRAYCEERHIVSEFVRFHPVAMNAADFNELYQPVCIRHTLGTNLKEYNDPIQAEFSRSCRKSIRQALNKGISFRVTRAPTDISVFYDIYYSTMKRDHASDFYFFSAEYFQSLLDKFAQDLIFVEAMFEEKTIAANLCFVADKLIHIHLSGTLSEYLYLSPAYILRYAVTLWGIENGYEMIHHGGGTSNDSENSLYKFKKQFAQNTEFDFYIGKKVWNCEEYLRLCTNTKNDEDTGYFPQYRKRL